MSARGTWGWRDRPVMGWLGAAVALALVHPFVPDSRWLMVHLVMLGAVSHAIMVWSTHFAETVLKVPGDGQGVQTRRLALLLGGVVLTLVGVPLHVWPVTLAGVLAVSTAVTWHLVALLHMLRRSLPARFSLVVHFSVAAAALLPLGGTFGFLLSLNLPVHWHDRLLVAHTMTNLLGWVGLTIIGTVLTLWPTMLRTKMSPSAVTWTRQALPLLVAGVGVVATAALLGMPGGVVAGLAVYAAGVLWAGRAVVAPLRSKRPVAFPTWSAGAGLCWLLASLVLMAAGVGRRGFAGFALHHGMVTTAFVVGFALQVLLGALAYLLPSVAGGGPSIVRASMARHEAWGLLRVVVTNAGLIVCLLPVPSVARVVVSIMVLLALASALSCMGRGLRTSRRLRAGQEPRREPSRWPLPAQALVGLLVVALGTSAGWAARPSTASAVASVTATGQTTTVHVEAKDMRFTPAVVEVPVGNRLVIELVNTDPANVHDLVLASGVESGRLSPTESARVDAGVVGASVDGWCSIVGHRQMGMTFSVIAQGAADEPSSTTSSTTSSGETSVAAKPAGIDFAKAPADGFVARDAVLAPLTAERVHHLTLTAREVEVEVAPGVRQLRWTFNGTAPGPTLHGRVGDTFVITLSNDGSMGHSIDFHAGALAPDTPMRTLAPGQRLTYRFTATRAGMWMYHCSTAPMSAHIAAGMHGAVVIEPDDLPRVDRSYVVVQSEVYLGASGEPVNVDKVKAEAPDAVVFNGYANQYDHRQLPARVGERVRVWVLDAGPSRPSSFHVVGGQFDTVFSEGAYLLRRGSDGGSQTLGLQAAQGGFVELSFPQAGHYPFVSHIMVDAERGAHGYFAVTG